MQALSQSSFLQALGYAIANSFWQVALLWLIALVINASFRLSSHNRYRVAITAQLAGFAWFVVTLQFYYQQCLKATANAQMLLQNNTVVYQPDMVSNKYNILSYIAKAEMLLPYLSLAYLCLLFVLGIRWFKSYRYTSLLKHVGLQKADMEICMFVQDMAVQLGIKQKVKIYLSNLVTCPLTIGFLKPIILVPVATLNHLTTQQLEAVLLHELAHIRRADYLINLLLNIIETILFFNPFTRLISQNINKEREHCCDDWVLQFKYSAPMYAEALLRIACLQSTPAIAMKAEGKGEGELLWRVKRLLNHKQKRFNYSQQMIALVVTTCMLVSVAWLQPANTTRQPEQVAAAKPVKAVVVTPMATQINNPFFNPLAFLAKPIKEEVQKATLELTKSDYQEAVNIGLDEADKALTAVAPTVLHELNKLNMDSSFEQAAKDAQKALKKIKWSELKNLSPFVDSAMIANSVRIALDQSRLNIGIDKAKQSIEASRHQISKLKQQNIEELLSKAYVNADKTETDTWIHAGDIMKAWSESKQRTAVAPRRQIKEKEKQHEQLRMLIERQPAPRVRSFRFEVPEENECNKKRKYKTTPDNEEEVVNWTYTNPVYVETAANEDDEDEEENSFTNYASQIEPAPPCPSLPPAPAKQLIHVEVTNEPEHLSIIITVTQ